MTESLFLPGAKSGRTITKTQITYSDFLDLRLLPMVRRLQKIKHLPCNRSLENHLAVRLPLESYSLHFPLVRFPSDFGKYIEITYQDAHKLALAL